MIADTVMTGALTETERSSYEQQGFFIRRNLYSRSEVDGMLRECDAIHRGDYGPLYSGAFQIEPEFAAAAAANPALATLARKVTYVVERSAVFRQHLLKPQLVDVLQDVLGPDILLFRDILMMKPAKVGSKMPWHQDSNYWPIEPTELCSVWTALDPATSENGCLRVIPGSHKLNLLPTDKTGGQYLADEQVDLDLAVEVPLDPGSSLFFHSRLLHGSEPNRSAIPRRAIIASFMSASSRQTGPSDRSRFFQVSGRSHPGCVQGGNHITRN